MISLTLLEEISVGKRNLEKEVIQAIACYDLDYCF